MVQAKFIPTENLRYLRFFSLSHDGGLCYTEISRLICSANQWTGFYMIETSVMKEFSFFAENGFTIRFIFALPSLLKDKLPLDAE